VNHLLRPAGLQVLFLFILWVFLSPPSSHAQSESRLWQAAASGDLGELKSAIDHGADVNFRGPGGFNALNAAARNGHLEIVQYLVEHGASIDQSDNQRHKTALLAASFQRHFDIVQYLVEKGANVNAQSINGFTPLHDAAYVGNLQIVQFLVEHGADVHIRNGGKLTPLETARRGSTRAAADGRTDATPEDYQKVIEYLKAHGG
jgi:uncharacterized protein